MKYYSQKCFWSPSSVVSPIKNPTILFKMKNLIKDRSLKIRQIWKAQKEREREREKEIEKDEESMRIGKERKSPRKTDVPKLYAFNECEHSVDP